MANLDHLATLLAQNHLWTPNLMKPVPESPGQSNVPRSGPHRRGRSLRPKGGSKSWFPMSSESRSVCFLISSETQEAPWFSHQLFHVLLDGDTSVYTESLGHLGAFFGGSGLWAAPQYLSDHSSMKELQYERTSCTNQIT